MSVLVSFENCLRIFELQITCNIMGTQRLSNRWVLIFAIVIF